MTFAETQYRNTIQRLAFVLLIFEGLFLLLGGVLAVIPLFTDGHGIAGDVIYDVLYGLLYAAIFIVPVFLFRPISKEKPIQPMYLERKLPRETPLYLFAGVAVITAAAYLNSYMVSVFDYSAFSEEVLWDQGGTANHQLILLFFTTAIVPAFAEEFLFRGLILSNLLPYGRTTAVFASALLFGVMHQNIEQLFYATVAGLVLGFVYVKTRSLWCCILLHFVNNFVSVLQSILLERLPETTGAAVVSILQGTLFAVGLISAVLLLLHQRDRRRLVLERGCFEQELPADPECSVAEIPLSRRVRLFFSPAMIAFLAVCLVQMLSLVLMAVLLY